MLGCHGLSKPAKVWPSLLTAAPPLSKRTCASFPSRPLPNQMRHMRVALGPSGSPQKWQLPPSAFEDPPVPSLLWVCRRLGTPTMGRPTWSIFDINMTLPYLHTAIFEIPHQVSTSECQLFSRRNLIRNYGEHRDNRDMLK